MKLRQIKRKALWILITLGMIFGLSFMMNLAVFAAEKTITGLGTGTITNPDSVNGGGWSYVYYGKFKSTGATKYRVLDKYTTSFGGRTMLLDCDVWLYNFQFDDNSNEWNSSNLKDDLNRNGFLTKEGNLTSAERGAIAESTKNARGEETASLYFDFAPLNGEKIFVLDAGEASYKKYGYLTDQNRIKNSGSQFWLRSPYSGSNYTTRTTVVYIDTSFSSDNLRLSGFSETRGVSPAFNVSLSSIISSSLISGTAGAPGAEYKLTLKDTTMAVHPGSITRSDTTITIPYTVSGNATQISVIMTNGSWTDDNGWSDGAELKYYKKLEGGLSGSGSFVLPQNYDTGWKTYLIAEAVKQDYLTDYASKPVEIQVPTESTPVPTQTLETPQESALTPVSTPTTEPAPIVVEEPITILKAPASVKATAKKNKVTVTWKKIKKMKKTKALLAQIKSVQVQYSTDPTFTQNAVTKTVGKNKTKAVLKLQKKTTYYVRVRYKGADGVSRWSGKKRVKTK